MLRTIGFLIACVSLMLGVSAASIWTRSETANDLVRWNQLTVLPEDHELLRRRCLIIESSNGGLRAEWLWGVVVNFTQDSNNSEYGEPGFVHELSRTTGPPVSRPDSDTHRLSMFTLDSGQHPKKWAGRLKVRWFALSAPHPAMAAVLFIWPTIWLLLAHRQARRWGKRGGCPDCGYDLRATPNRCPECGRETQPDDVDRRPVGNVRFGFLWTQIFLLPLAAAACLMGLSSRDYFKKPGPPAAPTHLVAVCGEEAGDYELRWEHGGEQTMGFVVNSATGTVSNPNRPIRSLWGSAIRPADVEAEARTMTVHVAPGTTESFTVNAMNGFGRSRRSNSIDLPKDAAATDSTK